jgi:hypothetical protein
MSEEATAPLLSFCLSARNDNYGGDFRYLLTTSLNFLGKNAARIGALGDLEVVIADWNSEVGLSEELALCEEARALCRFVRVPPAVAAPHTTAGKVFASGVASNVALRRARGAYLVCASSDILYSASSLEALLRVLRGQTTVPFAPDRALMLIRRKTLAWELVAARPTPEELDRYILESAWAVEEGYSWPGLNGNNGAIVAHRDLWHQVRGIDESMRGWGWSDIELGLRINQRYPTFYLSELGVMCYEMDVPPERRRKAMDGSGGNPHVVKRELAANDAHWGLGNVELATERASGPPAAARPESEPRRKRALLQELCNPELTGTIASRLPQTLVQQPDFKAGYLLGYCALRLRPGTFVDFGFMRCGASLFVPALHRCVRVVGVNPWQGHTIVPHANDGADLYTKLTFAGNLHFLSGDPTTAVERLPGVLSSSRIDLLYLMLDDLPAAVVDQLPRLAAHFGPSTAVVIYGGAAAAFTRTCESVRKLLPAPMSVLSERDRTALLLSGEDDARDPESARLETGLFEVLRQQR